MVRHIVFFTTSGSKFENARQGLALLAGIPHLHRFEIGTNIKRELFANDVDLIVYAEFESTTALDAYKAHPLYRKSTSLARPIREMRIAADFDSDEAMAWLADHNDPEASGEGQ